MASRSGLRQVAYDGGMSEKSADFRFRKRAPLTVCCCRTGRHRLRWESRRTVEPAAGRTR